jgi:hypothetical protein
MPGWDTNLCNGVTPNGDPALPNPNVDNSSVCNRICH